MSNRLFVGLLLLMILPFFGWMVYDSRSKLGDFVKEGDRQDVLLGDKGAMAEVHYFFRFAEPVYIHSMNTGQIEALSQSGGSGEHFHVYGLTQADYGTGTHYEVNWSKRWFKDQYDLWVEDLRVDFSYNTVNVYVTSDYDVGSCEYQATLEHENQHVEIHRRVYERYQKILQETIAHSTGLPLSSHPILVNSIEEGKKRVGEMISGVIDPVFERFNEDLTGEQAEIDTPESYESLREKCGHW